MLGTMFDDREAEEMTMMVVRQDMRSSQGGIWSGLESDSLTVVKELVLHGARFQTVINHRR